MTIPFPNSRFLALVAFLAATPCCAAADDDDGNLNAIARTVPTFVMPPRGEDDVAAAAHAVEDAVTLYVCGQGTTLATHTRWFFELPVDDDDSFAGEVDGWAVEGVVAGDAISAVLTDPSGTTTSLQLDPAAADDPAGLYTADDRTSACRTGTVVWEDPAQPGGIGAQGSRCDDAQRLGQVIILRPELFSPGGGEAAIAGRDDLGTFDLVPFE